MAKKLKVLLIQPNIRRYRADFFDQLSQFYDVTVAHFGIDESSLTSSFHVVHLRSGIFGYTLSFPRLIFLQLSHDLTIAVFDVHYLNVFLTTIFSSFFKPIVLWGQNLGRSSLGRQLRIIWLKFALAVLVYGDNGRLDISASGYCLRKIFTACNTQIVDNFEDTSTLPKSSFLFVGRLQDRKGLDILISAFASYIKRTPNYPFSLEIVGDGPILSQLMDLASTLKVDRHVLFHKSSLDPTFLSQVFSRSIAYVSPGHVGLGVLHSFSFGVPVITFELDTHAPEFHNIINDMNGILLPPSELLLSDALCTITDDLPYATKLGHNAYLTYLNKASPDLMLQAFHDCINYSLCEYSKS